MINIDEVFVANGIAILMMIFLLDCRQKNRERKPSRAMSSWIISAWQVTSRNFRR